MRSCYGGIEFEETPEISEPQVSIVLNVGSSSLPTTYNSALQRENKHAAVCPKKVSPSRVHHVLTTSQQKHGRGWPSRTWEPSNPG